MKKEVTNFLLWKSLGVTTNNGPPFFTPATLVMQSFPWQSDRVEMTVRWSEFSSYTSSVCSSKTTQNLLSCQQLIEMFPRFPQVKHCSIRSEKLCLLSQISFGSLKTHNPKIKTKKKRKSSTSFPTQDKLFK